MIVNMVFQRLYIEKSLAQSMIFLPPSYTLRRHIKRISKSISETLTINIPNSILVEIDQINKVLGLQRQRPHKRPTILVCLYE